MNKLEFRLLKAEEIEVRVASVSREDKGVTLLIYKDARVDQTILDETVGIYNWQRRHTRDNHNCIVSIWDEQKQQWIEKEDVGTESNTESEKGLASDSFKRACFNLGIGRELYTAPFIYFYKGEANVDKGKCYDKFVCTDITYTSDRKIKSVTVKDTKTNKVKTFNADRHTPPAQLKEKVDKKVEQVKSKREEKNQDATELKKKRLILTNLTKDSEENTQKYIDYMHEHKLTNETLTLDAANELIVMLSGEGK